MANRRLDWLIYTILHHIVPYYMRKHGRNAWRDEQRNLTAFCQSGLLAVALLAPPGAVAAPANPVRVAAGLAHAERAQSELLDAQLASFASKLAEARAAGIGSAALANTAGLLKSALISVELAMARGAAASTPLVPVPGGNSLVRADPAVLGGSAPSGSQRKRARAEGQAPPLVAVKKAGRTPKPKGLGAQLRAMPSNSKVRLFARGRGI